MASTVFILGAGASVEAGAPLLKDFLGRAEEVRSEIESPQGQRSFQQVFEAISYLQRAHSKSRLPLEHIEHVFAAFEMAATLQRFSTYTPDQIAGLAAAMKDVIVRTLERSVTFEVEPGHVLPPPTYADFVDLVVHLTRRAARRQTIAILTFNYDLALDFALYHRAVAFQYFLPEEEEASGLSVLKLHGSLNWRLCTKCELVRPMLMREVLRNYVWGFPERPARGYLEVSDWPYNCRTCGQTLKQLAFIVPPTWQKLAYQALLGSVWAQAAYELADAENIFFIGYSMPRSDAFFQYLYALSTISDTRLKRLWVFDPDADVGKRLRAWCGPGARPAFAQHQFVFSGVMDVLEREFPASNDE